MQLDVHGRLATEWRNTQQDKQQESDTAKQQNGHLSYERSPFNRCFLVYGRRDLYCVFFNHTHLLPSLSTLNHPAIHYEEDTQRCQEDRKYQQESLVQAWMFDTKHCQRDEGGKHLQNKTLIRDQRI